MSINFFHKLLNPHCIECVADENEARVCNSCVTLRQQLEFQRYETQQLLNTIIELHKPKSEPFIEQDETPVVLSNTRFNNFQTKRKELEEQSRIEASRLAQLKKDNSATSDSVESIQELEEMIGIGDKK